MRWVLRSAQLCFDGIGNMQDSGATVWIDTDRHNINAPGLLGGGFGQVGMGKVDQAAAFGRPDRLGGMRSGGAAGTHLDKHQCLAIAHDQIKLADGTAPPASNQAIAGADQVTRGCLFAECAEGIALIRHVRYG